VEDNCVRAAKGLEAAAIAMKDVGRSSHVSPGLRVRMNSETRQCGAAFFGAFGVWLTLHVRVGTMKRRSRQNVEAGNPRADEGPNVIARDPRSLAFAGMSWTPHFARRLLVGAEGGAETE
jgi:hypothetical protein